MTNNPDEILKVPNQSGRVNIDKNQEAMVREFFSPENFIKRLKLHMSQICKSKTKQATTLSLYFAQLRPLERQLNLIDYQPVEENAEKRYNKLPAT
jgi:hypothetical protein